MGLGATIKKVLKIALMSLGASSPEKKRPILKPRSKSDSADVH
jgi:hypothetical protein